MMMIMIGKLLIVANADEKLILHAPFTTPGVVHAIGEIRGK